MKNIVISTDFLIIHSKCFKHSSNPVPVGGFIFNDRTICRVLNLKRTLRNMRWNLRTFYLICLPLPWQIICDSGFCVVEPQRILCAIVLVVVALVSITLLVWLMQPFVSKDVENHLIFHITWNQCKLMQRLGTDRWWFLVFKFFCLYLETYVGACD